MLKEFLLWKKPKPKLKVKDCKERVLLIKEEKLQED